MNKHNCRLVWLEFNNAIFVQNGYTKCTWDSLSVEEAYKAGYLDRSNVKVLFSYNQNVWHWNNLSPKEAVIEIETFFLKYHDKFDISLHND